MLNWIWMENRAEYEALFKRMEPVVHTVENYIAGRQTLEGFCGCCGRMQVFTVASGALFGNRPNLREGMVCDGCRLTNRQRLLLGAIRDHWSNDAHILLLERFSLLHDTLLRDHRNVIGSEFLQGDHVSGTTVEINGIAVRHEDATALSLESGCLDGIVHNDILEHIPDHRAVFTESLRVLKEGGATVFCCPFFATRDEHLVRARHLPDGTIQHLEEPELHGDPMGNGILAYYHFGWRLLDEMRSAGFRRVQLGTLYEPFAGLTSNYHPDPYGLMLPYVLRGYK